MATLPLHGGDGGRPEPDEERRGSLTWGSFAVAGSQALSMAPPPPQHRQSPRAPPPPQTSQASTTAATPRTLQPTATQLQQAAQPTDAQPSSQPAAAQPTDAQPTAAQPQHARPSTAHTRGAAGPRQGERTGRFGTRPSSAPNSKAAEARREAADNSRSPSSRPITPGGGGLDAPSVSVWSAQLAIDNSKPARPTSAGACRSPLRSPAGGARPSSAGLRGGSRGGAAGGAVGGGVCFGSCAGLDFDEFEYPPSPPPRPRSAKLVPTKHGSSPVVRLIGAGGGAGGGAASAEGDDAELAAAHGEKRAFELTELPLDRLNADEEPMEGYRGGWPKASLSPSLAPPPSPGRADDVQ